MGRVSSDLGEPLFLGQIPSATQSQGQYRRPQATRPSPLTEPSSSTTSSSSSSTRPKHGHPHAHTRRRTGRTCLQLTRALLSHIPLLSLPQQLLPLHSSPVLHSMHAPSAHPASMAGAGGPVLTVRAVAAGLLVGAVLCFSNTYFGLQTGWVTMGSLQSAILGYGLFQGLGAAGLLSRHLNAAENVIVQTTAVATATMPLAAGLVGIIPALGLLTPEERPQGPVTFTPAQLLAWCSALAFFGVFVAVPLRYQTIVREQLRFPSGTATASVIRTLHGLPPALQEGEEGAAGPVPMAGQEGAGPWGTGQEGGGLAAAAAGGSSWAKQRLSDDDSQQGPGGVLGHGSSQQRQQQEGASGGGSKGGLQPSGGSSGAGLGQVDLEVAVWTQCEQEYSALLGSSQGQQAAGGGSSMLRRQQQQQQQQQWGWALRLLLWSFAISGAYSLAAGWIKPLKKLKVFDWLHLPAATAWGWYLQPSAGYIGQGMIMGPKTAWSMMGGAITGWAVLGPIAKAKGWAPGPIKDIETGAAGWLMWLGLALLLGDCFSELALLIANTALDKAKQAGWVRGNSSSSSSSSGGGGSGGGMVRVQNGSSGYQQLRPGSSRSSGLRSRSGSQSAVVAGSSLELSPSGSTNSVTGACAADGSGTQQAVPGVGPAVVVPIPAGYEATEQQLLLPVEQQQQLGYSRQGGSSGQAAAAAAPGALEPAAFKAALAGAHTAADESRAADAQAWLLSAGFWVPGLLLSTALATAVLSPMLGMPFYEPLVAVVVALLVALLAVRALGQTDLNPVSGVGKISQLVFAVVSPGAVLPNLVAGAIAEAGAQQAGDLMQDFKTAHLLGVAPSSQLVAMLLGSAASVPLSVAAYQLYTSAWQVPGPELPAPTAQIWLDMAKLVNGGRLPDHIGPFCAAAAAIAAALPVVQLLLKRVQKSQGSRRPAPPSYTAHRGSLQAGNGMLQAAAARLWDAWRCRTAVDWVLALLPSGVGFAVGCYLTPNWTVPRLLGSVFEQAWLLLSPDSHAAFMMVTASGLVLGEGCASVVTAVVQAVVKR